MFDLLSLRCFVEAARLGNFRAAARVCALSATAFSDRIRRLEEQLDEPLFERTTRRVRLTSTGERLVAQATRALAEAEACYAAATTSAKELSFTVGTRYELGMSWLVPHLARLEKTRPERTLHLRFGDSPDLLAATRTGEVDAVITSARLASVGLDFAALHEEHYCFVASPRLTKKQPFRDMRDAASHTLFDINAELPLFKYLLDTPSGQLPWEFARIVHLGTIAAIRHRVLEAAGVAVLPLYFVEQDLRRKRLSKLLPSANIRTDCFRLVWRRGHTHADELQILAGELASLPLR